MLGLEAGVWYDQEKDACASCGLGGHSGRSGALSHLREETLVMSCHGAVRSGEVDWELGLLS